MAAILNSAILNLAILDSATLVFSPKLMHTCQDWFPPFAQKKTFTHSFWLNLMMAAILNSTMLDPDTAILDSDTFLSSLRFIQKTLSLHSDSWLKLIQSDSNLFILTQLDDGNHLEFFHLEFGHLGFSHLSFPSQTYSHLPRLVPTICTKKKTFTHSFWLNLMMAVTLNSAMLDTDTLFSSLRFTQKHSHSTLTLTQTNSIWLKLIYSHSTWWWQPSWILPSWIWPSWIQPS